MPRGAPLSSTYQRAPSGTRQRPPGNRRESSKYGEDSTYSETESLHDPPETSEPPVNKARPRSAESPPEAPVHYENDRQLPRAPPPAYSGARDAEPRQRPVAPRHRDGPSVRESARHRNSPGHRQRDRSSRTNRIDDKSPVSEPISPTTPPYQSQHDKISRAVSVEDEPCVKVWTLEDESPRDSVLTVPSVDIPVRERYDQKQPAQDSSQARAEQQASVKFQQSMMTMAHEGLRNHRTEQHADVKSRQSVMEMAHAALWGHRAEKPLQSTSGDQLNQYAEPRLARLQKVEAHEMHLRSPVSRKPVPIHTPRPRKVWWGPTEEIMDNLSDGSTVNANGMLS